MLSTGQRTALLALKPPENVAFLPCDDMLRWSVGGSQVAFLRFHPSGWNCRARLATTGEQADVGLALAFGSSLSLPLIRSHDKTTVFRMYIAQMSTWPAMREGHVTSSENGLRLMGQTMNCAYAPMQASHSMMPHRRVLSIFLVLNVGSILKSHVTCFLAANLAASRGKGKQPDFFYLCSHFLVVK